MTSRSSVARIGALIKAKRRETNIGLRAAAEESGISASTLSRLERAEATVLPEGETLTKLAAWLSIPVASLLSTSEEKERDGPQLTTPEIVEVHLRADKILKPKTAEALAQMFKLLYEQLSEAQQEEKK